ncbi:MAG: bifunctional [glutamate--ammonia ligase]-adenylyl-L-tyrosine phosphorylase/[glutamate--ammonia-ligase] adenylyltransferase [Tatlockia sp.]|nr:bifunctional [glutamate--ammonia ligase]-adenylyl-L-tyrosine phosphorylase/[glutamate--ammonia-ligase] adenylyltransferase [Tatlockia sp.]
MRKKIKVPAILDVKMSIYLKHFDYLAHPLAKSLQTLLLVSDYACRQLDILKILLAEDDCLKPFFLTNYLELINHLNSTEPNFAHALRQFRHHHFLRLMLRELAGLASTEETMAAWSDCAEAVILKAIDYCQQETSKRYGHPLDQKNEAAELYVLAMGKLGGRELNFSSDIDLIFAFSESGFTDGEEKITNQQYYSKVVQLFVQLLQNVTVDGFVFRVDLRLRPNGESGALVSSLTAMETYYQEQGRVWERYAMVKARLLGEQSKDWFQRLIIPFVYRRYVDFSVIESLRSMKAMIEREVQLNPMLDDIKRGLGGIREVEFIIQNIQLIRGGRLPQLQVQNALSALAVLKEEKLLPKTQALKQAYLFLRKLENALQGLNDQQTHSLPKDELQQAQIALALGFANWDLFFKKLEKLMELIASFFRSILRKPELSEDEEKRLIANQLSSLWQGHIEPAMAINTLQGLNFKEAKRCYQMLHAFRHGSRCRRLSQTARLRLDRFMPLLLDELTKVTQTDSVLLQVLHLLENIVGRSAYLALLTENPQVIKELLYWFAHSPFITSLVLDQPFLLEQLLEQDQIGRLPSRAQLHQKLKEELAHCAEDELPEDLLRRFKLNHWLAAARAKFHGKSDVLRIARFLADVAAVVIVEVLEIACKQLASRYPEIMQIKSGFAIIGYGKLGSREMNFNSDLDLVFVHAAAPNEENLITRLSQKIMNMLTIRSQVGVLYSVDTRLRPSGSAGLLVSHIDSFVDYQKNHAWTWEHQALLRARIITGNTRIRQAFKQLKEDVLFLPRDSETLQYEVLTMRGKIDRYKDTLQVKYGAGGLLDLEFLVQFLILANPRHSFSRYTNTLSLVVKLCEEGLLEREQFIKLKEAYRCYFQILQEKLLEPELPKYEFVNHQLNVIAVSEAIGFL